MKVSCFLVWLAPLMSIVVAFFTSRIQSCRYSRYSIYFVLLFIAFIYDLQSISFRVDILDFFLSQAVLLVLADFFWRGIFMKNRIFRITTLLIAVLLFFSVYHDHLFAGPKKVCNHFAPSIMSVSNNSLKGYYIKRRGKLGSKEDTTDIMELYKKSVYMPNERKLSLYSIPEGYNEAVFTFKWHIFNERIAATIIGNTDTLWTLTDPGPPK